MKKEIKTFWGDDPQSLELIHRAKSLARWDVYDEIKIKFNWRKLRCQFRIKLIKEKFENNEF